DASLSFFLVLMTFDSGCREGSRGCTWPPSRRRDERRRGPDGLPGGVAREPQLPGAMYDGLGRRAMTRVRQEETFSPSSAAPGRKCGRNKRSAPIARLTPG